MSFENSDIIKFGEGGDFKIEQIKFSPNSGIEVRLRGTPTKLTINDNDRRLTFYRKLKEGEFWGIAINYVMWAIPFIIGIMGLILIDRVRFINSSQEKDNNSSS